MSARNLMIRLFSWLWAGVDGLRKILHLILLLFIFLLFFGLNAEVPSLQPTSSALYIQPYGTLVEQLSGDPYDRAVAEFLGDGLPETRVSDVVKALAYARDDDRIQMVFLDLSLLGGGGLSKLQAIGAAINDFQASGKKVVANADFMGQQAYFLAAHADEIYMHPDGAIFFRGYGRYRQFYKEAIDLLRVDWNVFRAGTHKSFVEPYERMSMSDEDRAGSERLVNQLWSVYQDEVTAARGLDAGAIAEFAENLVKLTAATDGDLAIAARNFGLVDELRTRKEVRDYMIEQVGKSEFREDSFNATNMYEYLAQMDMLSGGTAAEENVAVIVAAGDIMFGEQSPGTIGADSTAALLRRARTNDRIGAVVLRVDSPGGSAFASEIIAEEVIALREAGKPVVASMSSVAASGGYMISMHADKILASPATITGSIGAFAMFPTYQRSLEAIGIGSDGVGTTPLSGQLQPDREMTDETKQLLQLLIDDTYNDFISDVAVSRGMDKADVDDIGQGRVWTGVEALEFGLVDGLGDLDFAIEVAGELAGMGSEFGTIQIEPELSSSEQFIVDLLGVASRSGVDLSHWVSAPNIISQISRTLDQKFAAFLRFNDPKGLYTHCLCELN